MKRIALLLLALTYLASCSELTVEIVMPTVEQQDGSRALATNTPRFSWQYETSENDVVQQDYRIIVASTAENAQQGIGDLWDSGVTPSHQMLYIPYAGKTLQSRDRAYWKVIATIKNGKGKAKVESEPEIFD